MTSSAMQFKPAERASVKLKLAIQGPSGSGKTMGALALAKNLVPDGKVGVIDTENESASFYADEYSFAALNLHSPFTSARYVEAIKAAIEGGLDVLVIDSISHQWAGTGGILERKDELDQRGGNSYTNWGPFTKEHEKFKAYILEAPIHIISTLRTKQEYSLDDDARGKKIPKKLGMAPVQRDGFEYEFGIVFELQMDHKAKISKDRTDLFSTDQLFDLKDAKIGKALRQWLKTGKPVPVPEKITEESIAALTVDEAKKVACPGGERVGEPLEGFSTGALETMYEKLVEKLQTVENLTWARAAHAMKLIIADRKSHVAKPNFSTDPFAAEVTAEVAVADAEEVAVEDQEELVAATASDGPYS